MDKIKELVKTEIEGIEEKGITNQNLDFLYKLVDIEKDITKIELMKKEMEDLSMRNYGRGNYDREQYGRRRRDSRGRYMDGGEYGRRKYGHYPEEMLDRMMGGYEEYRDGMEEYNESGNYNAKDKGTEALEYMLESLVVFFEHIQENAENPEEIELIKKYARKIKEM
jgi:hypothetical protein